LNTQDRYKIVWTKPKAKNGFYSQQEVVVFGIENVEYVIDNLVPKDQGWDVYPM
jgi:hypothetical protein|tara:strand:- start:402 stop:563 length:162 start_codon:yes stop_codon:yes gene_type:complete